MTKRVKKWWVHGDPPHLVEIVLSLDVSEHYVVKCPYDGFKTMYKGDLFDTFEEALNTRIYRVKGRLQRLQRGAGRAQELAQDAREQLERLRSYWNVASPSEEIEQHYDDPEERDPNTYLPCEYCDGKGVKMVRGTCGGCLGTGNGLDMETPTEES